jgi:intracellular septation protein
MGLVKFLLEMGPLGVFFIANSKTDIFIATALFMAATAVSLTLSLIIMKRVPVMPLVTGGFVLVFGALTLYLQNEIFIKMKPTIVNLLFAAALAGGLYFGRSLMKIVLGEVIQLREEGWRKLTLRWTGFFIFLAILNEVMWRGFSTETWAAFKFFGIMPITFLFMMSQIGLLQRYQIESNTAEPASN